MDILSNYYVVVALRIAHIGGGIIWAGSALLFLFLLVPTVRSTQAAGQKFMENFGPRFGKLMALVTTVTVVSGALLYARFFANGVDWVWTTHAGLGFTIGALAALGSYVIGSAYLSKMQEKIGALGAAMASAGGPPKPEQIGEMNRMQGALMKAYRIDFVLLVVAVLAMSVARYL